MDFYPLPKTWVKSLSNKYGQKLLDSAKELTADAIKTAAIQKTAEATGDLIANKIADKITNVSKKPFNNNNNSIIMEYQKIANLLNDESNKPSKFKTRNWVEINDEVRGTYSHNKQIKFKTSMLRSNLCDYSDGYILYI